MKKSRLASAVAGAALALAGVTSQALEIGFAPQSQNPAVGVSASVDVVLSGLTALDQIVTGYNIDVNFSGSPTVQFLGGSYGTALGDPILDAFSLLPIAAAGGVIDLSQLSLLSDAELDALQDDSVVLATLEFTAGVDITSLLSISFLPDDISGIQGVGGQQPFATALNPTAVNGQIIWGEGSTVPLPATPLLVIAGLLALAGVRRLTS